MNLSSFNSKYGLITIVLIVTVLVIAFFYENFDTSEVVEATDSVVVENLGVIDGIHTPTGLKDGEGLNIVVQTCTVCHSSKLITQNRATRDGWKNLIVWMQQTQKLWELGENEEIILNYLEANYSPEMKVSRRPPLQVSEWYELK